jgi:hypothetical protein
VRGRERHSFGAQSRKAPDICFCVLTQAELEALAALEALVTDDADYVAVGREKLRMLCQVVRLSGFKAGEVAAAHAADKADRLERTA